MASESGPAPWSQGYKRVTKRKLARENMEWFPSTGYRANWVQIPSKGNMKEVRLYNGRTVRIPDADYEDFIGHMASPPADPQSEIGQYIDKAFGNLDKVQAVDGVGHITYIEYSPRYQLLRVEFETDGAVVVFFRVPKEVYSELYYLATSKSKQISTVDGKERHVLGMRFWDIIRIRGNQHGSRYRFEYAIEGEYVGKGTQGSRAINKLQIDPAELAETLKAFASRLTIDARRVFSNLTDTREMYNFLQRHNVQLPTYEELNDPNF